MGIDQSKIVILVGSFSVLPACAGVILKDTLDHLTAKSFTRMRGGDPEMTPRAKEIYADKVKEGLGL